MVRRKTTDYPGLPSASTTRQFTGGEAANPGADAGRDYASGPPAETPADEAAYDRAGDRPRQPNSDRVV